MNSLDMEVPADVCTFPCDKPCNPPSSPTAPSSPPPRLIEDFLFSHPSNNLNLPGANTPLSPRCYTALHMAGLSVHTKLVLGPRRARSSLRPGGGCRAGGGGWRGGGPGGGRWGPRRCGSPPPCQRCKPAGGLFCNSLEATASCARRYAAGKVPGPGQPPGGRGGGPARRAPRRSPSVCHPLPRGAPACPTPPLARPN